jgi:small subunit ribosomal protein S1
VGSIMDFVVERIDDNEGVVHLSREGAVTKASWETLQKGSVVEARVVSTNKGGLELEVVGGIRAFMPASQVDLHHTTDLQQFVGQKIQGVAQEVDRKSKKVVISRRQFLERQREALKVELWKTLEVGQTHQGKVVSLVDYGAFVDIGGVDGLIHVSDLSYKHVTKPGEVVKVGQEVSVKILKLDEDKNRISLGLKQVAPDPWEGIEGRLHIGEQVTGRVVRTADFGVFMQIEEGIEALLPASEISWKRNVRPGDMFKEGDVHRLAVLSIDPAKRRISLSLKQAQGDPWVGAEHKYAKNSVVKAKVISIADFGAFLEVEPGLEGLVHISELSDKRVNAVGDVLQVGQEAEFRVLEIDETNRRVRLSLKAVANPPAEQPATTTVSKAGPANAGKASKKADTRAGSGKGGLGKNGALGMGLGDLKF